MRVGRVALAVATFCAVLAVPAAAGFDPQAAAGSRKEADRAALMRAVAQWDERFNAGDVTALSMLYAENVVSMPYEAPTVHGRAAVAGDFKKFFDQNDRVRHITHVEELMISGDLAVERSRYELRFRPKGGDKEVVETGKHVECRRRVDGDWLIVWEIWNTDGPAAAK